MSPRFAERSRVIYPSHTPWFYPNAIFFSAYSQSDRIKLADKLFLDFYKEFGFYPKSVGAWWIDSYTLDYLKSKYAVKVALIVADQKTTDRYGVWGQWWGVPYYPSKANILTPASEATNQQSVVVIQWAQRDLLKAMAEGPDFSNYSLQANDYVEQGLNTLYFQNLVDKYLDCRNPLGQITVGLETGIESVGSLDEYKRQLAYLNQSSTIKAVIMSQFAENFKEVFPNNPPEWKLGESTSSWKLTTRVRETPDQKEKILYHQEQSFSDFFVADKNDFLDRNLHSLPKFDQNTGYFSWYLLAVLYLGIFSWWRKMNLIFLSSMLFSLSAFGLIFKSYFQYGWQVFYGPQIFLLPFIQIGLIIISFLLIWLINKWLKSGLLLLLIPICFGIDYLVKALRFSFISSAYYFGIAADALRFIGIKYDRPFNLAFVNQDFSSPQAAALLRIDYEKIWNNLSLSLIVYPLVHIVIAVIITFLLKRVSQKVRVVVILGLVILYGLYLWQIIQADPRAVLPLSNKF